MRIGPLRHRVSIQQKSTTRDSYGEESRQHTNISTVANVWASVLPVSQSESFVSGADQQQATITHKVIIRHRDDLNNELRILWGSRALDIEGITDPSGKEEHLLLMCREVQP